MTGRSWTRASVASIGGALEISLLSILDTLMSDNKMISATWESAEPDDSLKSGKSAEFGEGIWEIRRIRGRSRNRGKTRVRLEITRRELPTPRSRSGSMHSLQALEPSSAGSPHRQHKFSAFVLTVLALFLVD